jgi:hypothetical protein
MKKKSHSNVKCVTTVLLENIIETEEENFRIKDEPSEIKTSDDISENYDIKNEATEIPFNDNEMSQKEEVEISFNTETPTPIILL